MKPYNGKYKPESSEPYKVSRSKIENYVRCPRCTVLDRKHQIAPPTGPAFLLNSAVDGLYKKEFDRYRELGEPHPLVKQLGFDFVPFKHEKMDEWRNNFTGVSYLFEPANFHIYGAVDDIWLDEKGRLVVIDYKATAKAEPMKELGDAQYHQGYRRQIEIYQWLLRKNGFEVSDKGYWLYATARTKADDFSQQLVFDSHLIEHQGETSWVEPTILALKAALDSDELPGATADCEQCKFNDKLTHFFKN